MEDLNPGRGLDAKVSELMGYTNIEWIDGEPFGNHPDKTDRSYLTSRAKAAIPHYSSDIAEAWGVVDRFDHFEITKSQEYEIKAFLFYKSDDVFMGEWANGETVPHAISLAAIKAMAAKA